MFYMSLSRPDLRGGYFYYFLAEYIWSYIVCAYTCINVSKKNAESYTSLGDADFGRHISFASFRCVDGNLAGHNVFTSVVDRHKNMNLKTTSMATEQVGSIQPI